MQRNSRIFFFNLPENNLSIYKLIGKNIITIHVKMIFIENEKYKLVQEGLIEEKEEVNIRVNIVNIRAKR